MSKSDGWHRFLSKHKGEGYSIDELSKMYQKGKRKKITLTLEKREFKRGSQKPILKNTKKFRLGSEQFLKAQKYSI